MHTPYDVVIAAPHAHADEDRAAEWVARATGDLLDHAGLRVAVIINRYSRHDPCIGDCNRPESRGTVFRANVDEALARGTGLFLDFHSYRPTSKRFAGKDCAVLWTPELQDEAWPPCYAHWMREAGVRSSYFRDVVPVVSVERARKPNDLCGRARELGVPDDANLLVEHNDLNRSRVAGRLYARLHEGAIRSFFELRG